MHLTLIILSPTIAFLFPWFCFAADSAAVAALLKDTASECRYLDQLCEITRSGWGNWGEARKLAHQKVNDYVDAMKAMRDQRTVRDFKDAADAAMTHAKACELAYQSELSGWLDAVQVIKAKHPQMPKCYKPCPITEEIDAKSLFPAKQ